MVSLEPVASLGPSSFADILILFYGIYLVLDCAYLRRIQRKTTNSYYENLLKSAARIGSQSEKYLCHPFIFLTSKHTCRNCLYSLNLLSWVKGYLLFFIIKLVRKSKKIIDLLGRWAKIGKVSFSFPFALGSTQVRKDLGGRHVGDCNRHPVTLFTFQ